MSGNNLEHDLLQLSGAVEALRAEIAHLQQRLQAIENRATSAGKNSSAVHEATISEETMAALSAAIAAFLGYQPRIRHVRLLGNTQWALQGRNSVQGSHAWARYRARPSSQVPRSSKS